MEEDGPVREDVVGGQGGDVFEEAPPCAFGLTRLDPERVEAAAHGVEGKGREAADIMAGRCLPWPKLCSR